MAQSDEVAGFGPIRPARLEVAPNPGSSLSKRPPSGETTTCFLSRSNPRMARAALRGSPVSADACPSAWEAPTDRAPGKTYEYLADARDLVVASSLSDTFEPGDAAAIEAGLQTV